MKRAELEALGLTKEQIDEVMDKNGKDVESAKGSLAAVTAERDNLKATVAERDKQLEGLKVSAGDAEKLKKQIEDLQAENKEKDKAHAEELRRLKIDNAVAAAITAAKGKNAKAIRALLELEKAELAEDGTVKGLAEQMEKLKKAEDSKFLFDSERRILKGTKPAEASDPIEPGLTRAQFQRMGYKERLELFNNDPELYNELVKE